MAGVKAKMDKLKEEAESEHQRADEMEAEVREAGERAVKADNDKLTMTNKLKLAEEEYKRAAKKNAVFKERAEELQAKIARHEGAAEDKHDPQDQIDELEEQLKELKQLHTDLDAQAEMAERKVMGLRNTVRDLTSKYETLKKKTGGQSELEDARVHVEDEVAELQKQRDEIEDELDQLKEAVKNKQDELDELVGGM